MTSELPGAKAGDFFAAPKLFKKRRGRKKVTSEFPGAKAGDFSQNFQRQSYLKNGEDVKKWLRSSPAPKLVIFRKTSGAKAPLTEEVLENG